MAHYYDSHGNRGYDGYVVGYSASSESYVASSEEVVTMSGYPARPDLHDQVWPRGPTHLQPRLSDEHSRSPKFAHANGSPHGSPRKGPQYPRQYGAHLVNPHDPPRSPKFSHSNEDSPRKVTFQGVNNNPPAGHYSPPGGHYSGKYPNNSHDSSRKNFRDSRGGFSSNDDESSDEEGECRDGVCYPGPKYGAGGRQGYGHDKEKTKGNGYAAANYPVQHATDQYPMHDPYRPKSDGQNHYKQPEGNKIYGSQPYNAPAHTKPTNGAYYNPENEPYYAVPAPIKTRPERREGGDNGRSSPVSGVAHWTPFAESPKRGNQGRPETIDSTEAQRRYGNAPPQYAPPPDRRFAIDSKTAAMKYGGVFVN